MIKGYNAGKYDVAVIGLGHAGIEAALASSRLGLKTVAFTINLDSVGNMPCNPAIGGTAKGHLVRELDALGGEMGKAADKNCIQYRMLNLGKGPAVYSLRGQIDRREYQKTMKKTLEEQENLSVIQGEVLRIITTDGKVSSVVTRTGAEYSVKAAVICSGTYLKGKVIIGELSYKGGPDGMFPSEELGDCLRELGLSLRRFKTGTPPRINERTADLSVMEIQEGDGHISPFSFSTKEPEKNKAACYLTYTNQETHRIIRENLDRSPLFSGAIEGIGPRYCPSIEDKVVRFADKERHQLFIEPMGMDTRELYVQGFSSSMPAEIQEKMLHSIKGLENAHIQRPAYAIEYDCIDPLELRPTLETKKIEGLYGAGQFCGSSGYEEAAAQGIVAGINAALKILGKEPFVLTREDGYIGTLIDDLVTKGTSEPYRMMTSRTEYRLANRQDNADLRLMPAGLKIGLLPKESYDSMTVKYRLAGEEIARLESTAVKITTELEKIVEEKTGEINLHAGMKLADLLRRPRISYADTAAGDPDRNDIPFEVAEQVEIGIKYAGYIKREQEKIVKQKKLAGRKLGADIDYSEIEGLRIEAKQKLNKFKPETIGEAAKISGVSPADINILIIRTGNRR